jgi:Holliday junction resolvase
LHVGDNIFRRKVEIKMKKNKLKLLTKILAIIIICLISFVGIYVQKYNKMDNIVKDYKLSKDLSGYRQIILEVSDDEDDADRNTEENRTVENYELAKSVLENRLKQISDLQSFEELKDIDVGDYNLSLDKSTGKIYIQIPETDNTDFVVSNLQDTAVVEIKDSEDGTVYLTNDDLDKAVAFYNTTSSGTVVYLELQFNENGTEILKNLSENEYATIEEDDEDEAEETTEDADETEETESESEDTTDSEDSEVTQKEITLSISGSDVVTTSFDDPITDGTIDLSMNNATSDTDSLLSYMQSASTVEFLINSGALPLTYTITENQYVATDIGTDVIRNVVIGISIVFVALLVYMVISKKSKGLLAAISFVGFAALYLLLIRYTNVVISLETIVGITLALLINYVFNLKLLNIETDNKKLYNKEYIQSIIKLVPTFAIAIIFTLTKWTTISSFGMVMFWGILLIAIYNRLVTKNVID